jgi:hypothetical protein
MRTAFVSQVLVSVSSLSPESVIQFIISDQMFEHGNVFKCEWVNKIRLPKDSECGERAIYERDYDVLSFESGQPLPVQ